MKLNINALTKNEEFANRKPRAWRVDSISIFANLFLR